MVIPARSVPCSQAASRADEETAKQPHTSNSSRRSCACAGFAGSRSGALIASAWAALVHLGEQGYLAITKDIMQVLTGCRLYVSGQC